MNRNEIYFLRCRLYMNSLNNYRTHEQCTPHGNVKQHLLFHCWLQDKTICTLMLSVMIIYKYLNNFK